MLDLVRRILGNRAGGEDAPERPGPVGVDVAACAVFLEMAHIDGEFSGEERRSVVRQLREEFGLGEEEAAACAAAAREQRAGSLDLWRFTNLINENFTAKRRSGSSRGSGVSFTPTGGWTSTRTTWSTSSATCSASATAA